MNSIVTANSLTVLPSAVVLPEFPPEVRAAVAHYLAAALRERCAMAAAALDARDRPAPLAVVRLWLLGLTVITFAPGAGDFDLHASAVSSACADLPGWAFNAATQVAALRKFPRWPSPAEWHDWLADEIRKIRDTARALRALATASDGGTTGQPPDRPMTASERVSEAEAVAAKLEAWREEMRRGTSMAPGPDLPMARYLAPDQLAVVRDASPLVQDARKMQAELRDRGT